MKSARLLIEAIIPPGVVVIEDTGGRDDATLSADDQRALGSACESRRKEFAAGRQCARKALQVLGLPDVSLRRGEQREPLWPGAVVGSITHCSGYCAAAVARSREFCSIGIDAEIDAPLPHGVLGMVARADETLWSVKRADATLCWDRLLFSAKESVYKAWFPLTRAWLGFQDVRVEFDVHRHRFSAWVVAPDRTTIPGAVTQLEGFYLKSSMHLHTLVTVPRARPPRIV